MYSAHMNSLRSSHRTSGTSTSGRVVINNRSGHHHGRTETCSGPSQPCKSAAPAHHEIIFEQRDAPHDRHLRIRANVLQVLERRILHLAYTDRKSTRLNSSHGYIS